jgi:hypothetical protein
VLEQEIDDESDNQPRKALSANKEYIALDTEYEPIILKVGQPNEVQDEGRWSAYPSRRERSSARFE